MSLIYSWTGNRRKRLEKIPKFAFLPNKLQSFLTAPPERRFCKTFPLIKRLSKVKNSHKSVERWSEASSVYFHLVNFPWDFHKMIKLKPNKKAFFIAGKKAHDGKKKQRVERKLFCRLLNFASKRSEKKEKAALRCSVDGGRKHNDYN